MKSMLLILVVLASWFEQGYSDGIRGCFYTNWAQYRNPPASFFPEDIDPTLCSHIFYAFADMEDNRLVPREWNDIQMYGRVNDLKDVEPDLKTLLCVGGATFDLRKMSSMLSTEQNRAEFIVTTITFLRQNRFDGLDMNFQFPGDVHAGSVPEDKERYTLLCQEMRTAFDTEGENTGSPPLLMTSTVAANNDTIEMAYEIDLIAAALDLITVMTYNFQGSWNNYTGAHTALYPRSDEEGEERQLNMEYAAEYWVAGGAPPEKLLMGLASYANGFTLENSEENGMGDAASGPSPAGQWTVSPGMYAYYEVCAFYGYGATAFWHDEHKVPYAVLGTVWCSYDDDDALAEKVDFITTGGYAGWCIWALDLDDFNDSRCGVGNYPLLQALNQPSK